MGKPLAGKATIAASVTQELRDGIDEWLRNNRESNITNFLTQSVLEKLDNSGIHIPPEKVFIDGRFHRPKDKPVESPVSSENPNIGEFAHKEVQRAEKLLARKSYGAKRSRGARARKE